MKNLNEFGVQEINTQELKKVDGGLLVICFLAGLALAYYEVRVKK
ncbi:hypothetical protein [Labilibaculum euxinus]|nr:hypothetical protein [Labilibaculum euxinus]